MSNWAWPVFSAAPLLSEKVHNSPAPPGVRRCRLWRRFIGRRCCQWRQRAPTCVKIIDNINSETGAAALL
jgi:hypothetical protein